MNTCGRRGLAVLDLARLRLNCSLRFLRDREQSKVVLFSLGKAGEHSECLRGLDERSLNSGIDLRRDSSTNRVRRVKQVKRALKRGFDCFLFGGAIDCQNLVVRCCGVDAAEQSFEVEEVGAYLIRRIIRRMFGGRKAKLQLGWFNVSTQGYLERTA